MHKIAAQRVVDEKGIYPEPQKNVIRDGLRLPLRLLAGAVGLTLLFAQLRSVYTRYPDTYKAASTLAWAACPDVTEFQCAFLNVPMNYLDPRPNETVSLALRRLPATVSPQQRLGTIFINPGGPGGSGHAAAVRLGPRVSVIVEGKYDILSWDPRGINMTQPRISCFRSELSRNLFFEDLSRLGYPFELSGSPEREDAYYSRYFAFVKALTLACERNGNIEMLKSMGSTFAVRDIISIAEAIGELDDGINFWGFSYGTIIGAYLAGMFPQHVRRVINDGVSDATLHGTSLYERAQRSLVSTEGVFRGFLSECISAGPHRCSLANFNDSEPSALAHRIDKFINSLIHTPLSVASEEGAAGIITASDVKGFIFSALYRPEGWPKLAKYLYYTMQGNGSLLFDQLHSDFVPNSKKTVENNVFHRWIDSGHTNPSTPAVVCGDANRIGGTQGFSDLRSLVKELSAISPIEGEAWALSHYAWCLDWPFQAHERFIGPWEGIQTRFPIVFLSNTHDPVTPLASGKAMTDIFGNSSATLLIQDGYGHCSSAHPSLCTAKMIRRYFNDGVVPRNGTICKSDDGFLFPSNDGSSLGLMEESEEDKKLRMAIQDIGRLLDHTV